MSISCASDSLNCVAAYRSKHRPLQWHLNTVHCPLPSFFIISMCIQSRQLLDDITEYNKNRYQPVKSSVKCDFKSLLKLPVSQQNSQSNTTLSITPLSIHGVHTLHWKNIIFFILFYFHLNKQTIGTVPLTYRITEMAACQKSKCSSSWPPITTFTCIVNIQHLYPHSHKYTVNQQHKQVKGPNNNNIILLLSFFLNSIQFKLSNAYT